MGKNMKDKKVTIIGLGLIGGSLARALHNRLDISDITAVNRRKESIDQALQDGVICRGFNDVNDYVYNSDIIFICTPVKRTMEYIYHLSGKVKPDCIITDVGSTKGEIIEYVNSLTSPPCFVGGHPMAGTEKTGYISSFEHLFENALYVLSSCKSTTEQAINTMIQIVKGIGGIPVILEADEHDKITAGISHLPHIIASALVNMVKYEDTPDGKMQMLAAGGFRDITRIASSSPEMWENIFLSNKYQVSKILYDFIELLKLIKLNIETENSEYIYDFLQSAKNYRDSFSVVKTGIKSAQGLISPTYEIIVDVLDKPGIIGEIASILGINSVNIKNINVSNSREFEQGCLTISLPDLKSSNKAMELLSNKGYKVYNKA